MKHFGLIGYPLAHSFSQKYFEEKFNTLSIDACYNNFEIKDLDDLRKIIIANKLDGLNVTIPYKERVLECLDEIDEQAQLIEAVNCIKIVNKKLIGYNTDVVGFEKSLYSFIYNDSIPKNVKSEGDVTRSDKKHIKALLFGNGGSSKAIQFVLKKMRIPYLLVSRNELKDAITYSDLNETIFNDYKLLINATPVGMFPHIENKLPLPYHLINETHFAFDLIYNPEKTTFLTFCEGEGAQIKNGYDMLVIQAEASYEIWGE